MGDDALRGGVTRTKDRSVAVLFGDPEREARALLGGKVHTLVLVGLTPGRRYEVVAAGADCALRIAPASGAASVAASAAGFIRISSPCGAP